MNLHVVTCSLDKEKTKPFWGSWAKRQKGDVTYHHVEGVMGVVPAFSLGVRAAAAAGAGIIACFHDDLRIDEDGWDLRVEHWFRVQPRCGLAGFFGAKGLGASDIYASPYSPMQLARGGCGSNMLEAEQHGERWVVPTRVACFDGFSQIGRAPLMVKMYERLEALKIIHHGYDSAMGAMSIREGWENWMLPIKCHHQGGVTAVGSAEYAKWAKEKGGDQGIWNQSHATLYEELRDVLPLFIEE